MHALVLAALLLACGRDKVEDTDDDGIWDPFGDGGGAGGSDGGGTGGGTGASDGGGTGGGIPGECDTIDPEECEEYPECATIRGRMVRMGADGVPCVDFDDEAVDLGCMDGDLGCGDAETLAAPPSDPETCWLFPSTCVPYGWMPCPWGDYAEECP